MSINRFGKGTASAVPPRANKDQGFSVCMRTSFHYECALGLAALVLLPIHSAPGCWLPSQFPGKQPSQIVGNRGQREFHCHFGLSSGAELPYSSLLLQHSKHRFHQGLSLGIYSSSRRAAQLLSH